MSARSLHVLIDGLKVQDFLALIMELMPSKEPIRISWTVRSTKWES